MYNELTLTTYLLQMFALFLMAVWMLFVATVMSVSAYLFIIYLIEKARYK